MPNWNQCNGVAGSFRTKKDLAAVSTASDLTPAERVISTGQELNGTRFNSEWGDWL